MSDVARHAGVSQRTVSNVVNGHRYISQATRDKVEAAIAELDYRPQLAARQLRSRCGKPVYEVDERYSTTEALAAGARDADAGAACVILEQFLRSLP